MLIPNFTAPMTTLRLEIWDKRTQIKFMRTLREQNFSHVESGDQYRQFPTPDSGAVVAAAGRLYAHLRGYFTVHLPCE